MNEEALEKAERQIASERQAIETKRRLARYVNDPVGFGTEILGEHYTDEVTDVMRSVRDNPVTIAKSANGVGKSHASARIALWFFSVFDDAQVYVTAAPPIGNLQRILWNSIMSIVEKHPELYGGFKVKGMNISRNKESFIAGVSIPTSGTQKEREAKFNGKHAPHIMFVVDEGDAVPDEVYSAIESCMSGGVARLLIMFNPRATIGPVYYRESNGLARIVHLSAFHHPNVIEGNDVIPGAVTRETTLRRMNQWTRPIMPDERVDHECFEVPEFLVGQSCFALDGREYPPIGPEVRKITDPAFSYMVLGQYPPQSENQLINSVWIDNAHFRWNEYVAKNGERPPEDIRPILSVDIAEMGTDYNAACIRYGGFVTKFKLWSGIDVDNTSMRATELYYEIGANICFVDGTGVGSGVAPAMARKGRRENTDVRAVSVKVSNKPTSAIKTEIGEFRSLRDQLWWAVREWLRTDPTAMLPPDPFLTEELKTPTYRINPTSGRVEVMNKDVMRDILKRSPDRADALCLSFMPIYRPKWIHLDAYVKTREVSLS